MIDVETLDTRSTAVILSIGAVEFNSVGIGKTFYQNVSIDSCLKSGLTIGESTLKWWMEQSPYAQEAVFVDAAPALDAVLQDLIDTFEWKDKRIWANGADFDLPIISNAFAAVGLTEPWAFYNSRCYRTLKNIIPKAVFNALKVEPILAHNALDDAMAQAITTIKLLDYQEKCYAASESTGSFRHQA